MFRLGSMEHIYELGRITTPQMKRGINSLRFKFRSSGVMDTDFRGENVGPTIIVDGLTPYGGTLRTPAWHLDQVDGCGNIPDADDWHQDGGRMDKPSWMLLWTNVSPTQILLSDGAETKLRPYELTLVDNQTLKHKAPYLSDWAVRRRYFYRCHIYTKLSESDITKMKKKLEEWLT